MSVESEAKSTFNEDEDDAWLYGEHIQKQNSKDPEPNQNDQTSSDENNKNDFYMSEDLTNNCHENDQKSETDTNLNTQLNYDQDQFETDQQEKDQELNEADNQEQATDSAVDEEKNDENSKNSLSPNTNADDADEDDDDDDDDDDEDGDNVNIVISDIVNKPYSAQAGSNLASGSVANGASLLTRQKSKTTQLITASSTTLVANTALNQIQAAKPGAIQAKGVDLEGPGLINDVPTYDYDIQELKDDEKPWRKPGADITDYFNYGFNEETWIGYCMKQKRLRSENNVLKSNLQMIQTGMMGTNISSMSGPPGASLISINTQNSSLSLNGSMSSLPPGFGPTMQNQNIPHHQQQHHNPNLIQPSFQHKTQFHPRFPQPQQQQQPQFQQMQQSMIQQRKMDHMMGGPGDQGNRRMPQMGGPIFPSDSSDNQNMPFNLPPPHIPDFSAPPPGWPIGSGPVPGGPMSQQQQQQNMLPRIQQIQAPRMPGHNLQMQQQTNIQMMQQQQQSFQSSHFQFQSQSGTPGMVPQPGMHDRGPQGGMAPGYTYPPPFGRGTGPPQMIPPVQHPSNLGPTWEKPTTVEPQYLNKDSTQSDKRATRSSRSPSQGAHSPRRSKSPQQQQNQQNLNQNERYGKDSDNKTSSYKQRDYSGRDYDRDHRRSPTSPSRRSHRHKDHDRRDYDRHRERSRERNRDKSKEKSRDRSRDRSRSRDDKYKRSRHRSDDDDYRSSSKSHKRSKKSSRKDRDSNERDGSSTGNNQETNNSENKQD